jgi:hypothetical protein
MSDGVDDLEVVLGAVQHGNKAGGLLRQFAQVLPIGFSIVRLSKGPSPVAPQCPRCSLGAVLSYLADGRAASGIRFMADESTSVSRVRS